MNVPVKIDFSKSQLQVIRTMCAKDCDNNEFDLFLEMCRARGLNPLLKQIYAMVLHKDSKDPKKPRQLVIIVSIEGQRVIANRTQNYRPDERAPRFEIDPDLKDPLTNPAGLVSCEVAVYVHSHGGWHPVPAVAYWSEYAPIVDEWAEDPAIGRRAPTGRQIIDPRKVNWKKMPRILLAKCAEMAALRKAFPDDFSGLYGEEEMDRSHVSDLTASEILEEAAKEHRQQMLGGPGIMVDWMTGGPLEKVALGQFFDRSVAWLKENAGSPNTIKAWEDRNRHGLRDFWGYARGDADELKREVEKAKAIEPDFYPDPDPELEAEAQAHAKAPNLPPLQLKSERKAR